MTTVILVLLGAVVLVLYLKRRTKRMTDEAGDE